MKVKYLKHIFSKKAKRCMCCMFQRSFILVQAVHSGNIDLVKKLMLDKKIMHYFKLHGSSILLRSAVSTNNLNMVEFLLTFRPKATQFTSKQLSSSLYTAMMCNFLRIAKLLIRLGADLSGRLPTRSGNLDNKRRVSYLHMAIRYQDKELIELLLDHGADVNDVDDAGESVLHHALYTYDLSILELLIDRGCNVHAISTWGASVLETAILRGNTEAVAMLIEAGVDVFDKHRTGLTPMHFAAMSDVDNVDIAELLLKRGVPVDDGDEDLVRPLHLALEFHNKKMIHFLVNHGANINSKTEDSLFPLYLSIQFNNLSMVEFLLYKGARVNDFSEKHRFFSSLHVACMMESEEKINLLLDFGADVNISCVNEVTAFSMIENKRSRSARVMIRHMAKLCHKNLVVNDKDMKCIRESKYLNSFYEKCITEITRMKQCKFYDNITYYYVLFCTKKRLIPLISNVYFVEAFKSRDTLKIFPIYAAEMKVRFRRAEIMNETLQRMENFLNPIFESHLPITVLRKILSYLNIEDLKIPY